jgi:hypothetical protein
MDWKDYCEDCGYGFDEDEIFYSDYGKFCRECLDEKFSFYLLHEPRRYSKSVNETLGSLIRLGLMSFSAIGRWKHGRYGNLIALKGFRIWFSISEGEMTSSKSGLLLRVKFYRFMDKKVIMYDSNGDGFPDTGIELREDDQYFGSGNEVMIVSDSFFSIPPYNVECFISGRWEKLSDTSFFWKPPRPSLVDVIQPSIKNNFYKLQIDPRDDKRVWKYVVLDYLGDYDVDKMSKPKFDSVELPECWLDEMNFST